MRRLAILFALCPLLAVAAKPNVLLIMADDLRDFGGAFTKEVVKTPNLDRLRARGTTFERAYVQYPVCNPSRSSMMAGLRAEQTGIVGNDMPLRQKMPDVNGTRIRPVIVDFEAVLGSPRGDVPSSSNLP